ncbi:MAG: major facilitator superfamily domain-containing protein 1 [Calditrichaeota bacterium]|nr:major facilitator superfamily domain-containing protein 1 [Calditrichota bacterium]
MEAVKKRLNESAALRWTVLVLISGLMFSTYWFQDCLGPLKSLMESQLGFDSSQFGLLVASTTWANLALMIIVGGIALDKWGIRKTGTVFGLLATTGAFIVALASKGFFGHEEGTMLRWMIVGRILFGTGLETVCVMVSRTIVKWFKGHELALAMAINVGFGRLGSAGTNFFGVDIAGGNVYAGLSFAASLIGLGLIMFLIYLIIDVKFDKRDQQILGKTEVIKEDGFKFKDLTDLLTDRSFIYIAALCVAFYAAVFPFIQYAPDLLINKFGFSNAMPDLSGMSLWEKIVAFFHNGPKVTSLIPLGTILFTPIFGGIVDKKGKAATLMIIGSLLLIFAHLALSVFNSELLGYLGLLSLGIAFSLVPAAMWPSVAKIVPENRIGTAYATMFTIQNYGLSAFYWGIGKALDMTNPQVVAKIQSTRRHLIDSGVPLQEIPAKMEKMKYAGQIPFYNYTIPILMLVALGVISIFLAYQLKRADKHQGYGLELPSGQEGTASH